MIPIRDDVPAYTTPYVNYSIIALNVLVFLGEVTMSEGRLEQALGRFALTPYAVVNGESVDPQLIEYIAEFREVYERSRHEKFPQVTWREVAEAPLFQSWLWRQHGVAVDEFP